MSKTAWILALLIVLVGVVTLSLSVTNNSIEFAAIISALSTLSIAAFTIFYVVATRQQVAAMETQVGETIKSRLFEKQPVLLGSLKSFSIETPRLFYSPPEDKTEVLTRYFCTVDIENIGAGPATNIDLTISVYPNHPDDKELKIVSNEFLSFVREINTTNPNIRFMFNGDPELLLLKSLRKNNQMGPAGGRSMYWK